MGHKRRNDHGLSRAQQRALVLLEASGPGVLTTGATATYDGQPWINWRTAYSLHERGLARVEGVGEEAEVTLA